MLRLSLEALQIIDAIARKGSFAAAAEETYRVPSAVTYTIKKLEDDLGVQLFDRSGHRARLTEAGQALLEDGRLLLRAANDIECRVKRVATGWETELRIALDVLLPVELLWPMLAEFDTLESGTRIRLSREALAGAWDALADNRADLVIGAANEAPAGGGYATHVFGEMNFVFAVAPHHPLASQPEPLPASLIREHRVVAIADSARTLLPRTVGILAGQPTLTVPDAAAKLSAQIAGLGCGYLLRSAAAPYLADGRLVEKVIQEARPEPRMHAAWRTSGTGKALRWWLDRLVQDETINAWLAG
ncbi:DNA-binding transcriptional regulator, LysR family [Andreprevotia lacus DSM 23236]|jgi:DNA-binding transcriptional LysR family regulator|uniref:DNA-binding transcriptional regulator, LysR family n=1 Tax=Andreprevotia lacus DSM 23236 TaxID=1121001 RepID=A0A1W1XR47_9NEIS|nr:LysR family transcriptional regulator [Andreprevotia lacus]SMC26325.1 DNA-binding transcriptional regulator, LysR family [Andreprevotia lacus DSM 23236]